MANTPVPQPDIEYCPLCKGKLVKVLWKGVIMEGHVRRHRSVMNFTPMIVSSASADFRSSNDGNSCPDLTTSLSTYSVNRLGKHI